MKTSFSIVIPVYNAEKTIKRCLDSIVCQSLENVEILLINDGSTDESAAICKSYASRWPQIVYVEKPNGGVSSARNAGLDAAKNGYILFVDSDDYVPKDLIELSSAFLTETDWDWIVFSNCVDDGCQIRKFLNTPFRAHTRKDALPAMIDGICRKRLNAPWAKIYRRDLLEAHNIRFPLGVSVAEDRAFNIRYSMFVSKYLVTEQIGYFVNTENEQSLSRKKHSDLSAQFKISGEYVVASIRDAAIPETEKELYRRAYNFGICRSVYKDAKDYRRESLTWLQRQKALWKRCREINRNHMSYPHTTYCQKIALPIRLYQTWFIDLAAKKLMQKG